METSPLSIGDTFKGSDAFYKAYPNCNPGTYQSQPAPKPAPFEPFVKVPYKACNWIPVGRTADPIFTTPFSKLNVTQLPKFLWAHAGTTGFNRFFSWVTERYGTAHLYYRPGAKIPYYVIIPGNFYPFAAMFISVMAFSHLMFYAIGRKHVSHDLHHKYPPEKWARMSTLERHKARKALFRELAEKESAF